MTDNVAEFARCECAWCGAKAGRHPYVGITQSEDKAGWVALDICLECWKEPSHRKVQIKAHFFPVEQKDQALARAGSSNIGGS